MTSTDTMHLATSSNALEARLDRLERELSRRRRFSRLWPAAAAALLAAGIAGGPFLGLHDDHRRAAGAQDQDARADAAVREIRAERIILEDRQGSARITLEVAADGPEIRFDDDAAEADARTTRASIRLSPDGPLFTLAGREPADSRRLTLAFDNEEGPLIMLHQAPLPGAADQPPAAPTNAGGAGPAQDPDQEAEKRSRRVELTIAGKGPALRFRDAAGRERFSLALIDDEGPELQLIDSEGMTRLRLDALDDAPWLALSDETGGVRLRIVATAFGPRIDLIDEEGNIIWSAP